MAQIVHTDIRTPVPHNGGDTLVKFGELWKKQAEALKARFGSAILAAHMPGEAPTDMLTVIVTKEAVVSVLEFLRDDPECAYGFLSDLTATDETPREPRFDVVYHLFSHVKHSRIRVKTPVAEDTAAPTITGLWTGANWAEREVFDMFGIIFAGHPDLRRILMDERWVGHPLRKDYPLRGYQVFTEPEKVQTELLDRE